MNQSEHDNPNPTRVDRDLLISRVVDDAASAQDWEQLRALAEYDPGVWRELFEAQHAQAELAQAVEQAIAIADGIEAPLDDLPAASFRFRVRKVSSWAGWAVAASVAVVWAAPFFATQAGAPIPSDGRELAGGSATGSTVLNDNTATVNPFELVGPTRQGPPTTMIARGNTAVPDSAIGPYQTVSADPSPRRNTATEQLAEMPERTLLEVRPLPDGRLELIYVRKLIERAIVEDGDLYQVKPDDAGIDRTVPYRTRRPSSGPI
ncbi:MAG: hypothetical protein RIE77_07970 [Phycisphaerales bacterium]|jgi:hypothetical protein